MNTPKTIQEVVQTVCEASPYYKANQTVQALGRWVALGLVCAIVYLCWLHGSEIVESLWALVVWQEKPFAPSAGLVVFLVALLFVDATLWEVATAREKWAAVYDGKATDDLLVALVQNPHISRTAKADLAREIEQHGYVSAEALGQVAARAEREAAVQKRQVEIQRARLAHELGPGAQALLNYRNDDDPTSTG